MPTKERESENKNSAIGDSLNDRVDKEKNASTEHSDDDSKSSNEPVLEGNNLPLERIEEKIDSSIVRDNKELSKEANADENKTENESAETDKLFENEDAKESCESSKTVANEGTEAVQDNANKDIFSSKGGAKAEPNLSRDVDNKTIEFSKGAAVEDETVQLIEGTDKNTGLANDFEVEIIGKTTKSVEKDTKANTNQTSKTETEEQRKDGDADKTNQGSTQNAKKPALKDPDTIIESLVSAYNAAAGEGRKKSTQAVAQKEQEKPDQRQTRSQTQKTNINDAQTAKVIYSVHKET